jgi:hypothetical protein
MGEPFIWIIIAVAIAAFAWGAFAYGFLPPPNAKTLLYFQQGAIHMKRGAVKPYAREHVVEILSEAGVTKGFIAITTANRVIFSRTIPANAHQRLRNVLLNQ